jgi:hypothetical protein
MMNLTEEYLRSQEVTQGASNKILTEIKKLKERPKNLRQLQDKKFDLDNLDEMYTILKVIYDMVTSPMKPCLSNCTVLNDDCNLPYLIFKIMEKSKRYK